MFYMGRTRIAARKTAAEIQDLLGRKGARQVLMEYRDGEIIAVSFTIQRGMQEIPFRLPIRWEACLRAMRKDPDTPNYLCNPTQAKMTAWRGLFRWLQAQMAFVDTEMVDLVEVMLPYVQMGENTFYERLAEQGFKGLPDLSKGGE